MWNLPRVKQILMEKLYLRGTWATNTSTICNYIRLHSAITTRKLLLQQNKYQTLLFIWKIYLINEKKRAFIVFKLSIFSQTNVVIPREENGAILSSKSMPPTPITSIWSAGLFNVLSKKDINHKNTVCLPSSRSYIYSHWENHFFFLLEP